MKERDTRLAAELSVEPRRATRHEELVARGALQNRGDEPVQLDLEPLVSPSLALEIVDAAGAPVHLPPPPVPTGETQGARLGTGDRWPVEYVGFLPPWTPPGAYRARLRYVGRVAGPVGPEQTTHVVSEWAEFVVAAA